MSAMLEAIGKVITSMAAVTFALLLTIVGLLLFTHSLFYDALPLTIVGWERYVASWTLACAWELTLLLTTCNTHLLSKRIPSIAAVASGVVVLFFFDAFDFNRPHVALRWFLGCLVVVINWIFTALFHKKWIEHLSAKSSQASVETLETALLEREHQLAKVHKQLKELNDDYEHLKINNDELEEFRKSELHARTCIHCGKTMRSIYHLNAHKTACGLNSRN